MKFLLFTLNFLCVLQGQSETVRNSDQIFEHYNFPKTQIGSKELSQINVGILDDEPNRAQKIAQAISQLVGKKQVDLSFTIMQIAENDLTAYRDAVKEFIDKKVHIIVSSVVFHSYGNFKGDGFINKLVSEAARSGIFWIQWSPFFHQRTLNLPAKFIDHSSFGEVIKARVENTDPIRLQCQRDEVSAKIILSWNSFAAGRYARGTDKDLDLYLVKDGKILSKSERRQVNENPDSAKEEVLFPCEEIKTELSLGAYEIYIKKVSGEFDPQVDRVRLTIKSSQRDYYDFDEKKTKNTLYLTPYDTSDSVAIPADNREVFVVSEISSKQFSDKTWDGRLKPDLGLDKTDILFSNGTALEGASGSLAIATAFTLLLKAQFPKVQLTPEKMTVFSKAWFISHNIVSKKIKSEFLKNNWKDFDQNKNANYYPLVQKLLNNNIVIHTQMPTGDVVLGVWDYPSKINKNYILGLSSLSQDIQSDLDSNRDKLYFRTWGDTKEYLLVDSIKNRNYKSIDAHFYVEFIKPTGYLGQWQFPSEGKLQEIFVGE